MNQPLSENFFTFEMFFSSFLISRLIDSQSHQICHYKPLSRFFSRTSYSGVLMSLAPHACGTPLKHRSIAAHTTHPPTHPPQHLFHFFFFFSIRFERNTQGIMRLAYSNWPDCKKKKKKNFQQKVSVVFHEIHFCCWA